ncbi:MAG: glycosyltransferase family A protein, partial [Candidatus Nanopelagicales bacterium]
MSMPDQQAGPRFSIVTAVYDVARYLPDFIRSIDAQGFPADQLEVVAVDDGSHDESLRLLHDWAARSSYRVTVLTKPNGGQGSARNVGLAHARGEWVTFTDPDDMLDEGYLRAVSAFMAAHPDAQMIATNLILLDDRTGRTRDEHPLKSRFKAGNHLVDLDLRPEFFFASASAAFLRRDRINRENLRFDERIRPNFEDGHLCAVYLITGPTRLVGIVAEARYL